MEGRNLLKKHHRSVISFLNHPFVLTGLVSLFVVSIVSSQEASSYR